MGTTTFPRLSYLNVLIHLGLGPVSQVRPHNPHKLRSMRKSLPTASPICLNQGILPSRFATFPGSLPPCPVGVPSQPYSCILSPCAMVVDGWDCVGERAVWQGPLGATGIWTIGRPLEASAVDNPGPFLGMLHECMPVHLCVCVWGVSLFSCLFSPPGPFQEGYLPPSSL